MKKLITRISLLLISLTFVVGFYLTANAQTPRHHNDLTFPPLSEIQLPDYERYQLDNGMVVYLMEDRKLPLVGGSLFIRTGGRLEPPEKAGLARLTGTVMRTGGTTNHSPQALNEMLEQRAAAVESGISQDVGFVSFSGLSKDIDFIFPLFADVIRSPAFDAQQLALAKTQTKGAIARRNDNPRDIAGREFRKLIYGETSPYARTVEYKTLNNISRSDLVKFHQTYFQPDQMILGITGDFDASQMKQLIEKYFSNWQASEEMIDLDIPAIAQNYQDGVFMVDQPQLTQSSIILGHLGGKLNSPDYPALSVLNGVLSGFAGRLFNEVRSRQGLAYSVYGSWSPKYDHPGLFVAGGQTRTETTEAFIQALLTEIERIRTSPITDEELAFAKDSILNSFVFKFENPSQTLSRLMRYEYFGYPDDFIFQYQKGIKNTTIEQVQQAAQKYLDPSKIVTLVVGNAEAIQPLLSDLNEEIKRVDISIPTPEQS
ncbi:MAG: M16 family metallopeptidase [Microcystaceae cyanobacterium]